MLKNKILFNKSKFYSFLKINMSKILTLQKISNKVSFYKKNKKIVVMCHGAFDVLHYGHIAHFEEAKKLGDILIISVLSDKFINKGPNRPFLTKK